MKKLTITLAIILGLGLTSFAQGRKYYSSEESYEGEGGLFGFGTKMFDRGNRDGLLGLPGEHGWDDDVDGEQSPLGSGLAVLLGLGGAYLVAKKRKDE